MFILYRKWIYRARLDHGDCSPTSITVGRGNFLVKAAGSELDHSKFGLVCHRSWQLAKGPLAIAWTAGGTLDGMSQRCCAVASVFYSWLWNNSLGWVSLATWEITLTNSINHLTSSFQFLFTQIHTWWCRLFLTPCRMVVGLPLLVCKSWPCITCKAFLAQNRIFFD